jgi:hypothetical protein
VEGWSFRGRPQAFGAAAVSESGAIRGTLRVEVPLFGGVSEGPVPAVEVVGEFDVEDSGVDLAQEMGTARDPT